MRVNVTTAIEIDSEYRGEVQTTHSGHEDTTWTVETFGIKGTRTYYTFEHDEAFALHGVAVSRAVATFTAIAQQEAAEQEAADMAVSTAGAAFQSRRRRTQRLPLI